VLAAAPAKKAHRLTGINIDHGGNAKGRMFAQKYWQPDTPRVATPGLT
jgi:hypothetical protein